MRVVRRGGEIRDALLRELVDPPSRRQSPAGLGDVHVVSVGDDGVAGRGRSGLTLSGTPGGLER